MKKVFLSIGSNIEPGKYVPECLRLLKQRFCVKAVSNIYETEPIGPAGNQNFWNLAVQIETDLGPADLTAALRKLEGELGRTRNTANKYAPRTIDIDMLPQADYQSFAFIMIPLAEIAPHEIDKETGQTFSSLAESLNSNKQKMKRVSCESDADV